ncbi:MAG TPA: rod-binding protein [Verrucomicrobiae bacterium]|nr:rod-binding protein [Verrucomicrobiae bacterium]
MEVNTIKSHVNAADLPLEQLATNHALTEPSKIEELSRQFEAVLLRQILSEGQKTVFKTKYADDSTASQIYRDMTVQQLADSISRSGAFGLAGTLSKDLTRQLPKP